jgi:hypothetical protein
LDQLAAAADWSRQQAEAVVNAVEWMAFLWGEEQAQAARPGMSWMAGDAIWR